MKDLLNDIIAIDREILVIDDKVKRVVHCKRERHDVYIGRPSKWGNPFTHKAGTLAKFKVASRAEAVTAYEKWLRKQPKLMTQVKRELKGKILGCWCKPQACHGDVLAKIANEE